MEREIGKNSDQIPAPSFITRAVGKYLRQDGRACAGCIHINKVSATKRHEMEEQLEEEERDHMKEVQELKAIIESLRTDCDDYKVAAKLSA